MDQAISQSSWSLNMSDVSYQLVLQFPEPHSRTSTLWCGTRTRCSQSLAIVTKSMDTTWGQAR
jgi:hypothetical protein